jgi:hypothetical protein
VSTSGGGTVSPSSNLQINSLGVGVAASGTLGQINWGGGLVTPNNVILIVAGNTAFVIGSNGVTQLRGGTNTSISTAVSTPTVSSGVAFTPSANVDTTVYFQIAGGAVGSYTLTMGPTTGAENAIATAVPCLTGTGQLVTLRVPAGWKVVLTLSVATLTGGTATVVTS